MTREPTRATPSGPAVRRPPAPSSGWATVTRLGAGNPHSAEPAQVPVASVQGTLALDIDDHARMPETPELRVVPDRVKPVDDVQVWAARFAQAVVEVLGGDRPLPQLVRWTSNRVYADLGRRVRILGRTTQATQRVRTIRPQVRSVHVYQPTPEAAEVSVHVRHGQRSRALAARLDLVGGRWQCTALQLG